MQKFILLLLAFFSFSSLAQTVRVTGTVAADTATVKLGQITFFSLPDSTLRKGSYLDSTYFSVLLDTKSTTDFYLKLKVPGYSDTLIGFNTSDSLIELGIITPEKDNNLETVDIVYRKPMFKRTMDGISVNVEGTNLQTLTNLFEVLKASPRITSPDDEKIEIIGRGSPLILVDRQAIISNDELKAIPASQIERIEIVTNPSAKYRAQGSGNGVIEVYTKSFHLEGYNMTVRGSGGVNTQLQPAGDMSVGLSLKKKKFSLNGYLGANYSQAINFSETDGFSTDGTNRELLIDRENRSHNLWQYYNFKAAYNMTEKQRITFGVNGNGSNGGSESTSATVYRVAAEDVTDENASSISSYTWLRNSAFINYTLETDTNKSNLEVNLNYTNKVDNSGNRSHSTFENLSLNTFSGFSIRNESKNIPNVGELRVNYEHVFDTSGWKLGVGTSYTALINGKRFDQFNSIDNDWIIDPAFSNSYDYQEHIGALFAEVSKNWDKFGFRLGVRGEYTRLDGYSNSLEQQFMDSTYVLPFPTASLLFEPSENLGITVFYDSGIDRPQFSNYDPFVRVLDSLSIEYGNPYLRPAIEQTVGLDFDLFYSYNLSISYSHVNDPSSNISFLDEGSFLRETTPWNADSEQSISGSLSIPLRTKWMRGWNSLWVEYNHYKFTPEFQREDFGALNFGIYSYLTFDLPKNFSLMNRFYVNRWGGSEMQSNAIANWGMRLTKKFKGNNFQIFADVNNIIPPTSRFESYSANYQYITNSQNQFTTFKLGLFYKFGRLKAPTQIEESKGGQSDRL